MSTTTALVSAPAALAPRDARDRDERRQFEQLARTGDPRVRNRLIEGFVPLARNLARRYQGRGEPIEDLVQVACVGLANAVDRFDVERGAAFSTYAVPTILGELRRHFRDRTWAVRPPRDLQELHLRVERAVERLTVDLGRAPTVSQIAQAADVSDEEVNEALQAGRGYKAESFARPVGAGPDAPTLLDRLGHADSGYDRAEERATLHRLKAGLSTRQCFVLTMRYEHDMTQAEIGELLGVSQMQVSRILRQALERLREMTGRASHPAASGTATRCLSR